GIATRPITAIARKPRISWSASGEGDKWSALMIHRLVGIATSSVAIAAPDSQFRTMRIRSTTYAIGRAAEEADFDMIRYPPKYRISIHYLSNIVKYNIENR